MDTKKVLRESIMVIIIVIVAIVALLLSVGIGWYVYKQSTITSPIVPQKTSDALQTVEKTVAGKPLAEALPVIKAAFPQWKVITFDVDDPSFDKKFDAWDLTRKVPHTVVILIKKGVVFSLTLGPTGGNGWTTPDGNPSK